RPEESGRADPAHPRNHDRSQRQRRGPPVWLRRRRRDRQGTAEQGPDGRARNGQARGRSNQGGRPVRRETEPGLRDRNRGQGRGHPRPGEEIRRATTEYTEQRQKSEGKNKPLQQDEVPPRLALVSFSFGSFPCIPCIPWLLSWMGLGCPGRTDAHGG